MNISVKLDPRAADVIVTDAELIVSLRDGRRVIVPLSWFPRLAQADEKARSTWEFSAAGYGIHWPLIDEDLSVEGLLSGTPAPQQALGS